MNFKETKLNALYTFSSGLSKGKKFFGYGYPFLSYKTIFNNYYLPNRLDELVDATEKERNKCSIKRGDVFLTRTSETVDEIGISSVALKTYPNATFNGFAKRLRPITDDILPEYAAYYFRSRYFRTKASSLCTLITRASLNNNDLSYLTILYPEFAVQKKFASLLLSYDKLIENNTRRIQILEEMAQRIYKEWFVDFKYPGHENNELVESELGMIPEGWEVKEFGEKIIFKRGKNITKKQIIDGDIPVVAAGIKPAYFHNQSNTTSPIITISASGANAGYINLFFKDIWASDCSYINKEMTLNIFYYYSLVRFKQKEITRLQRGSAQPHVYPKDIARILIVDPKIELIEEFETLAEPMFKEIGILKKKDQNLRQTRDLLLPKLISGKVDVSDLDINIGES